MTAWLVIIGALVGFGLAGASLIRDEDPSAGFAESFFGVVGVVLAVAAIGIAWAIVA